ncbi:MAG TPA: hypothetical protein VH063_15095 [Gaiellaceae bacterium]|jgi:hypothetical protein|nr:hypothetical protein [Gaiellaceae bacterium]
MRGASVRWLAFGAVLPLALFAANSASANKIRTKPADQAQAKSALLKLSDLPTIAQWKKAPPDSPKADDTSFSCAGFHPKESDLVTTGDASSSFTAPGTFVGSEVTILSTEQMVRLDWSRSFTSQLLPCLKHVFGKALKGTKISSVKRVSFPHMGDQSMEYRIDYGVTVNGRSVHGALDLVVVASGRAEVTLMLLANLGAASQVSTGELGMSLIEQHLAAQVVARLRPAPQPLTA